MPSVQPHHFLPPVQADHVPSPGTKLFHSHPFYHSYNNTKNGALPNNCAPNLSTYFRNYQQTIKKLSDMDTVLCARSGRDLKKLRGCSKEFNQTDRRQNRQNHSQEYMPCSQSQSQLIETGKGINN